MDEIEDYDSGPFCRHWRDPADCDLACARCGHGCTRHFTGGDTGCDENGCACAAWTEDDPAEPSGNPG